MEGLRELGASLYALAVLPLLAAIVQALHRDMRRRGRSAWAYVLLLLLVPPVGLLAWYADRRRFPVLPN